MCKQLTFTEEEIETCNLQREYAYVGEKEKLSAMKGHGEKDCEIRLEKGIPMLYRMEISSEFEGKIDGRQRRRNRFIDMAVEDYIRGQAWRVTGYYGELAAHLRKESWNHLKFLQGRPKLSEALEHCELRDLVSGEIACIWQDWHGGKISLSARLDRACEDREEVIEAVLERVQCKVSKEINDELIRPYIAKEMIDTEFWEEEAIAVKNIPLGCKEGEDRLIWHYTTNGSNLVARRLQVDEDCPVSGKGKGDLCHANYLCQNVMAVWEWAGFWGAVKERRQEKGELWAKSLLLDLDKEMRD
ncbi:hypothetical protein ACH5RR_029878 [Cinchona calisaya]|uniref:Uncharacterized protein n=1 Tax=Cinchona calisaya TaxID=153742 RepID=A0ABD2YSZ9_9GENT